MNRFFVPVVLILWQIVFLPGAVASPDTAAVSKEQLARGSQLYARYCFMCHQASGQGNPPSFPPLSKSDFLAADKERSIRILITGLQGAITVRGAIYNGVMPPAPYDDEQLADVLTFVHNSFGNTNGPVTAEQVRRIRAAVASTEILADPNPYHPLPVPPPGFTLREVARLPNYPTKMAGDGQGKVLYFLCENADVWRVDIATGALLRILDGEDYAPTGVYMSCMGLMLDAQRRLYIVSNVRREAQPYSVNDITIYRTTSERDGEPAEPRPWFQCSYPWGNGGYNHGADHIATGPDGFLYVNSGARTDGNEAGSDPHFFTGGEVPLTACMWRLDPKAEKPEIEIFARGLRNSYGFCWNDRGEMFATENGPDADAPEELNQIERGKHYGFPYQFSNWTRKAYPYSPDPPPGLKFTWPIANLGPAAGGSAANPLYTFEPHSSPGGIVFLGDDFPPEYRGTFMVARFGNLLSKPRDVGFDLLDVRLNKNANGVYEAHVTTLLSPLARPVDLHLSGRGKVYIAEYTRVTNNASGVAMLPGRILELAVKP
jgi:glucose/arabinose dehydrogenase/mono/diheme cytochrome c family protein